MGVCIYKVCKHARFLFKTGGILENVFNAVWEGLRETELDSLFSDNAAGGDCM